MTTPSPVNDATGVRREDYTTPANDEHGEEFNEVAYLRATVAELTRERDEFKRHMESARHDWDQQNLDVGLLENRVIEEMDEVATLLREVEGLREVLKIIHANAVPDGPVYELIGLIRDIQYKAGTALSPASGGK